MFSSIWILEFFYYFCGLITLIIHTSFFGDCFLTSIFNYCLLTYWFAHSSTHITTKAARLKWLEMATSSSTHIWGAHHTHSTHSLTHSPSHSTTTKTTITKEIIIKSSHHSHLHSTTHTKLSKWIIILFSLITLYFLTPSHSIIHSMPKTSTHLMLSKTSSHSLSKSSIKKVIFIIKEASKWVFSSKEVFKNIISLSEIEMLKVGIIIESTTSTTSSTRLSSIDNIIPSKCIIFLSLFLITQYTICESDLFKYFFSCFWIIRVLIRMIF